MINRIKSFYSSAEETYLVLEDKLLDNTIDTYSLAKEYIQESSEEISNYIDNYFTNSKAKDLNNPILLQLSKVDISISALDIDSDNNWENKLILAATSLGHLNEKIVQLLCNHYKTNHGATQANKINSLKSNLSRVVINDFHYVNTYRNSILHANDFDYSLSSLNKITKNKLFYETKAAITKLEFIYSKLEEIKIN